MGDLRRAYFVGRRQEFSGSVAASESGTLTLQGGQTVISYSEGLPHLPPETSDRTAV